MSQPIWQQYTLNELGRWVTGSTPASADPLNAGSDVPFVTPGDISYGGKLGNVSRTISNLGADRVRRLRANVVLLVCIGTIGKVAWTDHEVTTNQQINALEVDESLFDVRFVHWLLASPSVQAELWNKSTSTTVALLNKKTLETICVTAPPLDEQRRIVATLEDHLSRLDKALGELKLTSQKRAHFQHSLLHSLFEGVAGEVAPLGQVVKPKYGKDVPKHLRGDGFDVPVVGSAGVMSYTQEALVTKPSVLVGRKGNVGAVQKFDGPCSPVDTAYYLVCPDDIDLDYLYYQLLAKDLKSLDSSTAIPSLRREDLEAVEFVKPSLSEQRVIAERAASLLSSLEQGLETIEASMKRLGLLRRSLLAKAFTGGLVE